MMHTEELHVVMGYFIVTQAEALIYAFSASDDRGDVAPPPPPPPIIVKIIRILSPGDEI